MDGLAGDLIGLGVAFVLDLGEGFGGGAANLELEDVDPVHRLGDEVGAALGLAVLGGDAESAGGEEGVEGALVGGLVDGALFGAVGQVGVEGLEPRKEGWEVAGQQGRLKVVAGLIGLIAERFVEEEAIEVLPDVLIGYTKGVKFGWNKVLDGEVPGLSSWKRAADGRSPCPPGSLVPDNA